MKTRDKIVSSQIAVNERDDGRHAARVIMLGIGLLFVVIFVLRAISP